MNIEQIIKLLKSSNGADILIGYELIKKNHSIEEINKLMEPDYYVMESHNPIEYIRVWHKIGSAFAN